MHVREAMSDSVLTVGPGHTLRQAARLMADNKVGSVVVIDPDGVGVGILSERAVVLAIAGDLDPDAESASDHLAHDAVYASPEWTLEDATEAMRRGGFRHLVVIDDGDGAVIGIISMRDIVKAWQPTANPATQS